MGPLAEMPAIEQIFIAGHGVLFVLVYLYVVVLGTTSTAIWNCASGQQRRAPSPSSSRPPRRRVNKPDNPCGHSCGHAVVTELVILDCLGILNECLLANVCKVQENLESLSKTSCPTHNRSVVGSIPTGLTSDLGVLVEVDAGVRRVIVDRLEVF